MIRLRRFFRFAAILVRTPPGMPLAMRLRHLVVAWRLSGFRVSARGRVS